jgi:hypothetical protein
MICHGLILKMDRWEFACVLAIEETGRAEEEP